MNGQLFFEQVKFLEPHLVIRICDHYAQNNTFDQQWLLKEKIAALLKTRMYDQIKQEVQKLNDQQFPNLENQIEQCKKEASEQVALGDKAQTYLEGLMANYEEIEKEQFSNKAILKFCGEAKDGILKKLTKYSFILYEVGQYDVSLKLINCISNLIQNDDSSTLNLLWGKIGCELVLQKFAQAKGTIALIRAIVEKDDFSAGNSHFQIYNRAYLIYHSLYTYFNASSTDQDFEAFVELVTSDKFLATIQMVCSEVIRYIGCALLLVRTHHFNLTSLLQSFLRGVFDYKDNILEFLKLTLIDFEFVGAEETLKAIPAELASDYFLSFQKDQILTSAHHLFFKTYCKVFDRVEIKMVSSFLNCDAEKAESWIVNFIRLQNIEAKIDEENGVVNITKRQNNFDENISNKIKDILPRSVLLVNNLKRITQQQQQQQQLQTSN